MNKKVLVILIVLVSFFTQRTVFGQYDVRKSQQNKRNLSVATSQSSYDSLHHSLRPKDWSQYVGQTFYMLPLISRRVHGYEGFYTSHEVDHKKRYYDNGQGGTYDSALVGKYLDVVEVIEVNSRHGKHKDVFLKLMERESGNTIYYSTLHLSSVEILVLGYLEKQKSLYVGNSYQVNLSEELNGEVELIDINTGKEFIVTNGQKDKVIDVSIYEFPRFHSIGYIMKTYDDHEYVLYWNEFSDYLTQNR
jgi:hypothetical protein